MEISHTDVLIVGAGPVGLALASLLKQSNIKVRLIEKNNRTTDFSKAIGIHARTLESMHALGIADDLVKQGHPMQDFRLSEDGRRLLEASFKGIGSPYEFVLGLPQSRTEKTLLKKLLELGGEVEWNTSITDLKDAGDISQPNRNAHVVVKRAGSVAEHIECRWLIGTDGSRSTVRQLAEIDFPGSSYGNAFILGDVRIDWNGDKKKLQFFLSGSGYLLVIPMPNGMHRIIAQTDKKYEDFQGAERPTATLEELQKIVDRNGPGGINVHSPAWLTTAPFYHRRARSARRGRTLLAGDSFHLFSPLGAQGLNTGFQDAFNLAWKIAFIEKGWASNQLIDTYDAERGEIADLIGAVTSSTTRYITATAPHKRLIRKWATQLLSGTKRAQETLPKLMSGVLQRYSSRSFLVAENRGRALSSGERFPHFWIFDDGRYLPMAAMIHGSGFSWLLVARRLDDAAITKAKHATEMLASSAPFVQATVVSREFSQEISAKIAGLKCVEDRLGGVCELAGTHDHASYLIRPDGYIAIVNDSWDCTPILSYFEKCHFLMTPAQGRFAA